MKHAVRLLVVAFCLCFAGACAAETMTVREYSERWATTTRTSIEFRGNWWKQ